MTFKPASWTGSFQTIGYYQIWERCGPDNMEAPALIAKALSAGELRGYVQAESDPLFYEVPADHWKTGGEFEGTPADTLNCLGMSDVEARFQNRPLLFRLDEVEQWEALLKVRFYQANGWPTEYETFEECLAEATVPREGQWPVFVVLAWIASGDEQFTAAAQQYGEAALVTLGHAHAQGGWRILDRALAAYGFKSTAEATENLRESLERGRLYGGKGKRLGQTKREEPDAGDWADMRVVWDMRGVSLLDGLYDFRWSSDAVRAAFPAPERTLRHSGLSAPVVQSTAAAISECVTWLKQEFAREETRGLTKSDFQQRALAKWPVRLSGRGFRSAWDMARKAFPERGQAGAKAKSGRADRTANN